MRRRLEPQVAEAEATAAAQRQVVERLHNGSRPQEIAEARANVESARADAVNARGQYERRKTLAANSIVSQQDLDNAKAALDVAEAKLAVIRRRLIWPLPDRARKTSVRPRPSCGPTRRRRLSCARSSRTPSCWPRWMPSSVRALWSRGRWRRRKSRCSRSRSLDPKWVRAYVAEPDIGKLRTGMAASVALDSFPHRRFNGWVGFISPVAEFTPKTVETTELRTSLVYEVRIFVKDPSDELHLGSPATVYLPTNGDLPSSGIANIARVQQ